MSERQRERGNPRKGREIERERQRERSGAYLNQGLCFYLKWGSVHPNWGSSSLKAGLMLTQSRA